MDVECDCEGLLCPLPVLRARKRLLAMAPGQVLALRTTDKMALVDVPHFCVEAGHVLLSTTTQGTVTTYRIQRG
jgi:tRNA 2-thiouridine synthesizing protein A